MTLKNALTGILAISLAGAPVAAQAAQTEVQQARPSSEIEGENIRGGWLLPLAVLVAVIIGVLLLSDDDEGPASP